MDEPTLRSLSKSYLVPLFSGAELSEGSFPSNASQQRVAFENRCNLRFKVHANDNYRIGIKRSQFFDTDTGGRVTEKRVVEAFVDSVDEISDGLSRPYKEDLLSALQRRIVAKSVGGSASDSAILAAIDQLTTWSSRLYEGQPISVGLGFVPETNDSRIRLAQIASEDFGSVLSNGFDTLLSFDPEGNLQGHEALSQPALNPVFAPLRYAALASWASEGRIALSLNRLGEILVFRDQKLVFARRSGGWHFLTHEPMLTQLGRPQSEDVRKAVYETCMDASFARTGACIGVVLSHKRNQWKSVAVSESDYLADPTSTKSMTIARAVGGQLFHNLDRKLRQELVAIDGATLIDHNGVVLAVGAILNIPGGSSGGGRRAAAVELSKMGLGIKVSQDGGIVGFHDGVEEPKFRIM
ncbi:MAG: hypothetical protein KDN05_02800 [Verrucomicrobiae bacterium]|nr:hypothetical protein [Verrucomicrobiae bacterium]